MRIYWLPTRLTFLGFICVCATAQAQNSYDPQVSVSVSAEGVHYSTGEVVERDEATAPSGSVSASASMPHMGTLSQVDARTAFGRISAHVKASDSSGVYDTYSSGGTFSQWHDTITVNASGLEGARGMATAYYIVQSESTFEVNAGAETSVSVDANIYNGSTWESRPRFTLYQDGSFAGENFIGKVVSFQFGFAFGAPSAFRLSMGSGARSPSESGELGDVEITSQLIWLGIGNIQGPNGPVPNASVASASGTNFLRPIGKGFPVAKIRATPEIINEETEELSTVTVTLNNPATMDLSIPFLFGGTAVRREDFRSSTTGIVTIRKGKSRGSFTIRAENDRKIEPTERVLITLLPGPGYAVGDTKQAGVKIISAD